MVNGHQVRAGRERAFDLQLHQSRRYRRQDMAAAEHRFAERHKVGNRVDAIPDELLSNQSAEPFQGLMEYTHLLQIRRDKGLLS